MRQVFILRYKYPNEVEAFESYDDAMDAGVDFISQIGNYENWPLEDINDAVSEFVQFKDTEVVEFYCCNVKEACQ